MFWICFCSSTALFFPFFSWLVSTIESEERRKTYDRIVALLVAYPLCSIAVLLSFVFEEVVNDEYKDLPFLGSVIVCKLIVFLVNKFLAPEAIGSTFKFFIHGLILALAIISVYYDGWTQSLPILSYFLGFYIDFDFENQREKKRNTVAKKKEMEIAVLQSIHAIIKQYGPNVGYCFAIIIIFCVLPTVDRFLQQNWVPICLPWFLLISYYFLAVTVGKNKRKKRRQAKRRFREKHNLM